MSDWEINKPLGHCYGTERQIQPEEEYYAVLVETDQGLERRDFCLEYWQQNQPEVYCYWKTKMASLGKKQQLFIDDEMLMAFFERLGHETEQEKLNFRFVVALILMRKRRLKYEASLTQDGKEIWSLRVTGDKRIVEVLNPGLDEHRIEDLSSQLGQILQVEL